jgi:hypothetical protein
MLKVQEQELLPLAKAFQRLSDVANSAGISASGLNYASSTKQGQSVANLMYGSSSSWAKTPSTSWIDVVPQMNLKHITRVGVDHSSGGLALTAKGKHKIVSRYIDAHTMSSQIAKQAIDRELAKMDKELWIAEMNEYYR